MAREIRMRPGHHRQLRTTTSPVTLAGAILLAMACVGGCSWTSPIDAHRHIPTDEELISPTVTIVAAGKPVPVELTQTLDAHKSGTVEDLRFRVLKPVRVGDLTVIETGAEAIGRAFIKTPSAGHHGELYLEVLSTTSVTGSQIALSGFTVTTGSSPCEALDCLWPSEHGGYAAIGAGIEINAVVASDVALPTKALESYINNKFSNTREIVSRCGRRLTVHVYRRDDDSLTSPKIYFDTKEVGHLRSSTVLTLVPSPGNHVIEVNSQSIHLELEPCEQYYVRVFRVGSWPKSKTEISLVRPERGEEEVIGLSEKLNEQPLPAAQAVSKASTRNCTCSHF